MPQLFEYDAQAQRLTRVSIGQGGSYDADGNVGNFHEAPQIPVQRFNGRDLPTEAEFHLALSPDGSTVLFTSAASLAPGAISAQPSVFEYRDGSVYLISDGRDASATNEGPSVQLYGLAAATEPEARDVFFATADSLVPQDGETQVALYDARALGGFPAAAFAPGCTEAEACRGVEGSPPQLGSPASSAVTAGENLPPLTPPAAKKLPKTKKLAKKKPKVKSKRKKVKGRGTARRPGRRARKSGAKEGSR